MPIRLFSGTANIELTQSVSEHLSLPVGKAHVGRFSDGEITVEIKENVRGRDIFIIQSTSAPSNDNLMEVLIMADALRRSSAGSITAVMPYFGYARQDRRPRSKRVPITAKVVADMLAAVGISRLITVDLHAEQIQGFFYMPVDNIYSTPIMIEDINNQQLDDPIVVSPDVGGVMRARAMAKRLNSSQLAIIDKRRPNPNEAQIMNIIGDVNNRHCIIVDDMIDTGGTICQAAKALKEKGAKSVRAYCTHPILSGNAVKNIASSELDEMVITDTIQLSESAINCKKIRSIPIGKLLAETIYRIKEKESVSSMFNDD